MIVPSFSAAFIGKILSFSSQIYIVEHASIIFVARLLIGRAHAPNKDGFLYSPSAIAFALLM